MRQSITTLLVAGIVTLAAGDTGAYAQSYPNRPIRVITEVGAGTSADIGLRLILRQLSQQLGQQVILENRPGGTGILATQACVQAPPDGYTLCSVSATYSINVASFVSLPYDPRKDIKVISGLYNLIAGIGANAKLPVNSINDLRALVVAKPNTVKYATSGDGSGPDITRQIMGEAWGGSFVGIPYKEGIGAMFTALLSGEADVASINVGGIVESVRAGKVKLLAVDSAERLPAFPDIPTYQEGGFQPYGRVYFGLGGPAGLPDAVVARLRDEVAKALKDPAVVEGLAKNYLEVYSGSPDAFTNYVFSEMDRYVALLKKFNVAPIRY